MNRPLVSFRRPVLLGCAALAVLAFGLVCWAMLTTISAAIVAPGQIEVEHDRQIVQHPDGGVIAEVRVVEGAVVREGEVLAVLEGDGLRSELTIIERQLTELEARTARLEAELRDDAAPVFPDHLQEAAKSQPQIAAQVEGQRRLFQARIATLDELKSQLELRIDQMQAQSTGISAQSAAVVRQLELTEQELSAQQSLLDKGLAQSGTVLALNREKARLTGQMGELAAALAQVQGQITEVRIQIGGLVTARREEAASELRDVGPVVIELAERRRALLDQIARLEIRAPVSGIVLGLQITRRAVLGAGDPVLYLVPQDHPLVVAAHVSPVQVDEVVVGQNATIRFTAIAARDVGPTHGIVRLVSADVLTDTRTGAAYYRVEVEIRDLAQLASRLRPGMPAEVYLETGRHTPLAYLVKPLAQYFARAFRES
jgi:HlyD family secretion protein